MAEALVERDEPRRSAAPARPSGGSGANTRWRMLAVIFLARISMGFQFQVIASVAPYLVGDLELSYAQVGWLIGLFSLPGALIALPGGLLGQRFGRRRVAALGLALMVAGGLLTAWSSAFPQAGVGRVISGTGSIILNLAFVRMVSDWFVGKEIATAMGIMLTAWPVGIALGLVSLGGLATQASWRVSVEATAVFAALALLLMGLYRDPVVTGGAARSESTTLGVRLPVRDVRLSLVAGLAWSALNAALFVFVSFGPDVLIARGASVARAGVMVSLSLWVTVLSLPLGGYLADRFGRTDRMVVPWCLVTAVCMAAFPLLPGPALWSVLGGLLIGPAPGVIMALLPGALTADKLPSAFGIYYTVFYAGVAVAQPLAGLLLDVSGRPAAPIFFASGLMAFTVIALAMFRQLERRAPRHDPPGRFSLATGRSRLASGR